MQIDISKSNYASLIALIDRAYSIITSKNPTTREHNVARQLLNIKKKIERKNLKQL